MQIQRLEFEVKRGCMPEALTLLKGTIPQAKSVKFTRLYTSRIGQQNKLAMEVEWQSLAEYEKGWAAWTATPQFAAFLKRWDELIEKGREEIWDPAAV